MALKSFIAPILLRFLSPKIYHNLSEIKKLEFADANELKQLTDNKLTDLIEYCYKYVPYYKRALVEYGVVYQGKICLENYKNLPPLTKKIIRKEGKDLLPQKIAIKGCYQNTSGGSTGEPVRLYQDKHYECWNTANKLYFNSILGKKAGDSEIKLWGSDRDILLGSLGLKERITNFLYNRRFFNCYQIDSERLERLRILNNTFKPVAYWAYMEAAKELAEYILTTNRYFHSPKILISTIGVLTDQLRKKIEASLGCDVYNQYGSREVGAIACECKEKDGLHTFPWTHFIELLDDNLKPVKQRQEGEVYITPLQNYTMPLLRYQIGDVAVSGGCECKCGRNTFKLQKIIGRSLGYFIREDGSLAHSHFIVQALFFYDWIERFQVIQEKVDLVKIVIKKRSSCDEVLADIQSIKEKCRILMGEACKIEFEFVEQIKPTPSGKYLYTICKVAGR